MNPLAPPELLKIAIQLAATAGRDKPLALHKLFGGKNNRVFKIETSDAPLVIKCYFKDLRDPRDRLGAEWSFLQRAWKLGVRTIPEPLANDPQLQVGLYSFAVGRKLSVGEVKASHVDAAIDFVLAINQSSSKSKQLGLGSEACFSLVEHLHAVEQRISRLDSLDPNAPQLNDARRLISKNLLPAWAEVKRYIEHEARALGLPMEKRIPQKDVCVSPSDFGFHNAVIENDVVTFLDFEYAGQDDPAKLISDFFCQPEIPIPIGFHKRFISCISSGLGISPESRARCAILLDVYRIKWACILLNEFLPVGAARRAYSNIEERVSLQAIQLAKANAKLMEIGN